MSDELSYLIDLLVGVFSRRFLRLPAPPGYFLPRDVRVIVRSRENSIFLCQARTDEITHVMPYYEQDTWKFIKSIVRPGDTCVDVGAHIGTYTVPLAHIAGPDGLVVAIEPSPLSKVISLNARLNRLRNVIVLNKAAYSERKMLDFYFTPMATGEASIHKDWMPRDKRKKIQVEAMPLDELLVEGGCRPRKVRLLKIDVEGTERQVLKGACDTLKITKYVVFEASPWTVRDCLRIFESTGTRVKLLEESRLGLHNFLVTRRE